MANDKFRVDSGVGEPSIEVVVYDVEGKELARATATPEAGQLKKGPGVVQPAVLFHELPGFADPVGLSFDFMVALDNSGFVIQHAGRPLSKEKLKVHDDPELYATATAVMPMPPKRPRHPHGKTCGSCNWFDITQGKAILLKPTHNYENGSFSMWNEIATMFAECYGLPGITEDNVGFCADTKSLLATMTPACDRFQRRPRKVGYIRRLLARIAGAQT